MLMDLRPADAGEQLVPMWSWAELLMVPVDAAGIADFGSCWLAVAITDGAVLPSLVSCYWCRLAYDAMGLLLESEAGRLSPRPLCTWTLLPVPWWCSWAIDVEALHILWRKASGRLPRPRWPHQQGNTFHITIQGIDGNKPAQGANGHIDQAPNSQTRQRNKLVEHSIKKARRTEIPRQQKE
ncbi:hypothetical protein Nepgr_020448 [Nepenthes gracilis]|uniref:Uncharacterized protein n=1 Tax=Nepenthes gracilis TaxID=150966 RepID=A0AAD3SX09_NEPGR|nr:hypothetical protein Nepgr_020448 [Nepenthes gracilis]